jgi:hypothetical protein
VVLSAFSLCQGRCSVGGKAARDMVAKYFETSIASFGLNTIMC